MPLKRRTNDGKEKNKASIVAKFSLAVISEFKTSSGKFNVLVDMLLGLFAFVSLVKPISDQIIGLFRELFLNSKNSAFGNYDTRIILLIFLGFSLLCLFVMHYLEEEKQMSAVPQENSDDQKNKA